MSAYTSTNGPDSYTPSKEAVACMAAISKIMGEGYKRATLTIPEQADVRDINCELLTAKMPGMSPEARGRAKRVIRCLALGIPYDRT